jgi:acetoin utilization deacetylase AcuC-like enzyme
MRLKVEKLAVVKDPIYLEHHTGGYHPENHHRLEAIYEMLEDDDIKGKFEQLRPRKATREEIEYIHLPSYYTRIEATSGQPVIYLDPDTMTSARSFEAALYAAGGVLTGIDAIYSSQAKNIFALIRPPGHHAEKDRGMGFCLFNNIAIGAAYAMKKYSADRVLIVDWDLHHGNGTQKAFYRDSHVLYFSTHQYPYYPGSGDFDEVGQGEGKGYTVNVPLSTGKGDAEFYKIFKKVLEPIAGEYKPELVLVSAGFDSFAGDPLGGMGLTPAGYGTLIEIVKSIADNFSGGKLLMALEGGYDLAGLRECVKAVMKSLLGENEPQKALVGGDIEEIGHTVDSAIESVKSVQKKFWNCMISFEETNSA